MIILSLPIALPKIVGIGVFDASITYKGCTETKDRSVSLFELDFVTDNGGQAIINGKSAPITENLLIFAKPGSSRHTVLPFRCYFIHLTVPHGEIYDILTGCPDTLNPKEPEKFKKIYLKLVEAYNFPDEFSELVIAENILALCRLIKKEVRGLKQNDNLRKSSVNPEIIENAISYIEKNYAEKLTLKTISEHVNVSPTYFHKLFLKAVGISPNEFLLQRRIRIAKNLLLTTDIPLVEIASECGFSSQSYFNYAFKRATGTTPKEYRSCKNSEYLL
ncbi:MAG: helix-turn-helix transcriptional regulator [Clostridia bacterium]|nr:helix-turn-helix transcriptional regulator [Clostridia bacterium]